METKALQLSKKYKALLSRYEVNTNLRLAHFFAQIGHESGLKPISENLNYSAQGLLTYFKKYFTAQQAKDYARKPEEIANKVYSNRMGNGDEASGDGWKYRGRGFIQITGKNNYIALRKETTIDYVNNPDLLLTEADAMISALWYWRQVNANKYADQDNLDAVSDLINMGKMTSKVGDANGYEHRKQLLTQFKKLWTKL